MRSLETAIQAQGLVHTRADIGFMIGGDAQALLPVLAKLADKAWYLRSSGAPDAKPPILVLPIDQGEELFLGGRCDGGRAAARANAGSAHRRGASSS